MFGGAGAEGRALARPWSETSCTDSLAPWGLGLPRGRPRPQARGEGPLEGVSRAAPPLELRPRSPRRAPRRPGCPRQPRPLAVRRGPGSVRGTRSLPRGAAQVSAGAAGREWGSAPISRTGKLRGGRHGGGGEGERTAVGAGAHSRRRGAQPGPGRPPARPPPENEPPRPALRAEPAPQRSRSPAAGGPKPGGGAQPPTRPGARPLPVRRRLLAGCLRGKSVRRTWGTRLALRGDAAGCPPPHFTGGETEPGGEDACPRSRDCRARREVRGLRKEG